MSSIVPLSKKKHSSLTYLPIENYSFASSNKVVPLLPFEVVPAAQCFPIVFADGPNIVPHALLGLGDKNIFVDEQGHWKATYLPLIFSNFPFSIYKARFADTDNTGEGTAKFALGIEEDAPHFHQQNGQPLFDENGEPTAILKRIEMIILTQYKHYDAMCKPLDELAKAEIITEKTVTVQYNSIRKNVVGLRCADREKILGLTYDTLGRWVKNGCMELLFAHWQSMRHLRLLLEDPSCPALQSADTPS